tara:strand:+ start:1571 stop:1759 length:189 start_codon:yes stop_codon:yes gene_type:complete
MTEFIVQLEAGVWLAPWSGDPGRTLVEASAKRFDSFGAANTALGKARRFRPFVFAEVKEVPA